MEDHNETVRILKAEAEDQLTKRLNAELFKVRRLRLLLQELRRLRVAKMGELEDDTEQVEQALRVLNVSDYWCLKCNKESSYLLNLGSNRSFNLSYTERKAVRQHLTKNLQLHLKPVADMDKKLRSEFPEIFVHRSISNDLSKNSSSLVAQIPQPASTRILALIEQRRCNLEKLVTVRNRKCVYLKEAAELKLGPYLANEFQLLYAEALLNQTKAKVLRAFFVHSMISRSEHSLKALKEVESYIDKILEEEQLDV